MNPGDVVSVSLDKVDIRVGPSGLVRVKVTETVQWTEDLFGSFLDFCAAFGELDPLPGEELLGDED